MVDCEIPCSSALSEEPLTLSASSCMAALPGSLFLTMAWMPDWGFWFSEASEWSKYERQGSIFHDIWSLTLSHSCSSRAIVSSLPLTTCRYLTILLPLPSLNFLLTFMEIWGLICLIIVFLTVLEEQTFRVPQTLRFPGRDTNWCCPCAFCWLLLAPCVEVRCFECSCASGCFLPPWTLPAPFSPTPFPPRPFPLLLPFCLRLTTSDQLWVSLKFSSVSVWFCGLLLE